MDQLLVLSMADSTRKTYDRANFAFEKFVHDWGVQDFSLDQKLHLFVTFMSVLDRAPQTIATYVSAIHSAYCMRNHHVENEFLLTRMLRGVKKFNKGMQCTRLPLLVQQLSPLCEAYRHRYPAYQAKLLASMTLTAFYTLLRVGKITNFTHNLQYAKVRLFTRHLMEEKSLTKHQSMIILNFGTTKTDPTGEKKQWTWIESERWGPCPVTTLLSYLEVRPTLDGPLFSQKRVAQ